MKRWSVVIFCVFLVIFIFSTKLLTNASYNYEDKKKVIQEVARAYLRKGTNMQFESIKRDYFIEPEQATADRVLHTTCHTFAYQIYRQAFNIEIPKGVSETFEYCKIMKKDNPMYVPIYYVPNNFTNTLADYQSESQDYKKLLEAFATGKKEKDTVFTDFINKLEVGDIITQRRRNNTLKKTADHTMVVYKFIYDEQGNKTDCYLIESLYSATLGGGQIDKDGDKLEQNGTLGWKKLSDRLNYYAQYYTTYKPVCLVVLRPLGNTGSSYCSISMAQLKAHNENNNEVINKTDKTINLTKASMDRLNYPGIDISKISSKHNDSVVGLGDKITYTLEITNNSNTKYNGINVKEIIDPELVELVDKNIESTVNQDGKIELAWNNIEIKNGNTEFIKYTVKVKKNKNNFNKKIISEGKVNNIKTATVTNIIGTILSSEEKSRLREAINNIDYTKYTNGMKLVSDIYYKAFGVDINLKKSNNTYLKVSEIIKTNDSNDIEIINKDIEKSVLNNCYGTWEASCRVKDSSRYYVWGTASQEVGDQRARTILKGNLNYGDIILIEDNGVNTAYIYLYNRIIGANEVINGEDYMSLEYDTEDKVNIFLANLTSKDAFVIISPVLNHDMTKTELTVGYSTKNATNKNVTVTITANEKVQEVEGWTLSNDEKKLTKEYTNNITKEIVVSDLSGNETKTTVNINNIDKQKPTLNTIYSTKNLTNQNVIAKITANEKVQAVKGWSLSSDGLILTKEYTANTSESGEEVVVKDLVGNDVKTKIKIANIDKELPVVTGVQNGRSYSRKATPYVEDTNLETVQLVRKEKSGETIVEKYCNGNEITRLGDYKLTATDIAENTTIVEFEIEEIPNTKDVVEITKTPKNLTNQDVIVTITKKQDKKYENLKVEISKDGENYEEQRTNPTTITLTENGTIYVRVVEGNEIGEVVEVKVENIDKEKPVANVTYSTKNPTNQNVVVTITANEKVQEVEGWTLSSNGLSLTKEYTANTAESGEEVLVKDLAENRVKTNVKVENIDKEKPVANVTYSTKEPTNQNVVVTITANEKVQEVGGWILSNDGLTLTKEYTENSDTNDEIIIKDLVGNETISTVKVENIDKEEPILNRSYSTKAPTNQNVIVSIIANEKVQEVEGWTLSSNKLKLTKEYTENTDTNGETIIIKDLVGNETIATVKVKNIDKENPTLTTKYSNKALTNQNVVVTITANERVQEVAGWNISNDGLTLTKEYTANTAESGEEVLVIDLAENAVRTNVKVENIDKEKPVANVTYSTKAPTNQNVVVTITANEKVQEVESWSLSSDGLTLTKTYTANTAKSGEEVVVKDLVGNEVKTNVKVENIDKEKPVANVTYSTKEPTNQNVVVTITANEKVQEVEGWTLSSDGLTLTKEYTANTAESGEEVVVKDLAGNVINITVEINNIVTMGDVDNNNEINIMDILIILRHIAQSTNSEIAKKHPEWELNDKQQKTGDVNRNNEIDIADVLRLLRYIACSRNEEMRAQHPEWLNL